MSELNGVFKPSILQLSYGIERANTFIIEHRGHAVIIDACSKEVAKVLKNGNVIPDYLILTHEHCDHLWGVNAIRKEFPMVQVIAQKYCCEAIGDPKRNRANQYHIYITLRFGADYQNDEAKNRYYSCKQSEIVFEEKYELVWHGFRFELSHAPGHSPGSILIYVKNVGIFSGDSILKEETFLKFDDGDEAVFNSITIPQIQKMPKDRIIFPGHGDIFRMSEWKQL